jgi:hypothetical protein
MGAGQSTTNKKQMTRKEIIDELLAEAFIPSGPNSNNLGIIGPSSLNNQAPQITVN